MNDNPLAPVGHDRHGPMYSKDKITQLIVNKIEDGSYFKQRTKAMTKELSDCEEQINQQTEMITRAIDRMITQEDQLTEVTKKVTGRVRDASQKLSDGLNRVEKTANFERLSRYADLLERVERSLSSLAELEKLGLLNKVSQALK